MAVEQIRPVRDIDYYLSEPSLTPVRFEGKGAALIGIRGEAVTHESAAQLFGGYSPDGVRLPKYMHPERRGAYEITINLSKCGSLLERLGGDTRIKDLLEQTAQELGRFIEKEACVRVRKKAAWGQERKPGNLTWAVFTHPASRANDPHLHAHLVFFNLAYDRHEKTWKAVETGYIDQRKMGEVAHRSLVKGLRQLGYKVKDAGREFEIVGVPAEVKAQFSRRHDQIKELESQYEKMSPKAKGKLSLYERPEKVLATPEERRSSWLKRISDQQLKALTGLVKRAREAVRRKQLSQHLDKIRKMALIREGASHEAGRGISR